MNINSEMKMQKITKNKKDTTLSAYPLSQGRVQKNYPQNDLPFLPSPTSYL